jgi:L-aminopeptidase/D-esterase-like protein
MKQLFDGSITKVHGIRVGHAQNKAAKTGCTVVLCSHDGAVVASDVRGAAPGTRETDLCRPDRQSEHKSSRAKQKKRDKNHRAFFIL